MKKIKAIKAVSLLWIASLFGAAAAFLLQILMARYLSVADYGQFSSVLAVLMFLTPLAAFGLPQFWLKIFGQEGWSALKWLQPSLKFALLSTIIAVCLALFWALLGGHSDRVKYLYFLLLPFLLGNVTVELVASKYQLEERYYSLALLLSSPSLIRLGLALVLCIVLAEFDGFFLFGLIYFFIGFLVLLFFLREFLGLYRGEIFLVGHGAKEAYKNCVVGALDVFKGAFPFGLAGSFHLVYFQGAVVLLAYLASPEDAGIYNTAFLVMSAVYLFPSIVYQRFLLPKIHRWSHQDPVLFYTSFRQGSLAMLGLGILASIAVWVIMPHLLPMLFGNNYIAAVPVVCVLSLCAPIRFMATSVGSVLVTQKHIVLKVRCMAAVAAFSLIANLTLIPGLGISGALITTFLSELFLLGSYYTLSKRFVFCDRGGVL